MDLGIFNQWILTVVTFLPLLGALVVFAIPREDHSGQRSVAFFFSVVTFLLSVLMWVSFKTGAGAPLWQFEQNTSWIPALGARYHVGIDGVSLLLIVLATFLTMISIYASYTSVTEKVKSFYAFLLMLETGMLGVFIARDVLLFYLFWEAMLIPMYFIIGVWGGPNRIRAAVKFFLYTMFGSLLMLVGILVLYFHNLNTTGVATFDLNSLVATRQPGILQGWLFFAFFLAFAIKVPMFPFHTWLPEAHVEAPTAGSVILAGVLLKMGTYGFFRFAMPLFPMGTRFFGFHTDIPIPLFPISIWPFQFYWFHINIPLIIYLAIIGIIYGALVAIVQRDVKKLVAYSSVSHLGFVMLGLFALNTQGVMGSLVQSINHGISTGALFLLVGVIYERRHTREIADFGGVWNVMPAYGALFVITMFSSLALPGLNGFVGEFPILLGAFERHPWFAVTGAVGMILGAVYLLWMFMRAFQGPVTDANRDLKDLTRREWTYLMPLIVLMFGIGLYPRPIIEVMEPAVNEFLRVMRVEDQPTGTLSLQLPPEPVTAMPATEFFPDPGAPAPGGPEGGMAVPPEIGGPEGAPGEMPPGMVAPGEVPPGMVPPGGSTQPGHEGHNHP